MYSQEYYQEPNAVSTRRRRYQSVNNVLPSVFPGLLGAVQLLLWIAIIILEIVSVYYDPGRGTIYAGFWCSIVFFLTWISMFCYLCCGKSLGCGRYLVILNTISAVFAIILVVFTSLFVNNPCLCFDELCYIPQWDDVNEVSVLSHRIYPCTFRTMRKVPVLKGLLACAAIMLACNIIFVVTYLIMSLRIRVKARSRHQTPNVTYEQRPTSMRWSEQSARHSPKTTYLSQQYQPSYPMANVQRTSPWPSAPPVHTTYSEKF